ncbi:hypothetical protein LTS18_006181 [Coniosporium uncinatum]|uniref:Uncharacterized protein n=1 Tax=Coniosporium uncinatum TaxID=93489 RepID=A0ACC3DDN4_9PEZI|nr:hypothetical protein LTS18_006181 [Coniosporium uncinatum]
MDFASLMKSQISKAKSDITSSSSASAKPDQQKYLKRSDLEAQRQAAYRADQARLETERLAKQRQKRKFEEEEAEKHAEREEKRQRLAEESRRRREEEEAEEERKRRKRLGLPELKGKEEKQETPLPEGQEDIEDEVLTAKLRGLEEPVKLFGETHRQRLKRYFRLTGQEVAAPVLSEGPIPTYLQMVEEKDMLVPVKPPPASDVEGKKFLFRQLASYFTMVLREWEIALARRPMEVRESFQGRKAYDAMVQARDNMRPFFKRMEKSDIPDDVLAPVTEIVRAAQERRYVDANDGYLRLSIGKAAWPIGVTMVGIHERSAREKLHGENTQAHIMSDEVTRKYLQSIKRCLTFAQTRWPPEDQGQLMG